MEVEVVFLSNIAHLKSKETATSPTTVLLEVEEYMPLVQLLLYINQELSKFTGIMPKMEAECI